ncbi:class I SAM-dependent methyltransferase [Cellulomonas shaoxiangyii]|uniref:Class I SAM-dependent methyltransferase n=1 Tax=Cellulomonas shaoxiangyii TaxID=2566013 RepID=A0A4P7SM36_9CELL|nr:class I SAM-dependent methyltransferase [Cellulomonas shaoxiangyii]QCB94828.1 class I SAM-dependent methyltransferase [Cellulomonas shaoxiangyii]TGY86558.1 class I SAM-dependent methyltransferase [Cellulomonas shaoxiangyii]
MTGGAPAADGDRGNHNAHYHRVVLDALPPGARTALDVGCGEGTLARRLAERVPDVTGVDLHGPSLDAARAAGGGVTYVEADVLTHPFPPASFDLVASVATLHHLDARAGLLRLAELVRPGGRLAVVGLARSASPRDLPYEVAAVAANAVARRRRGYWEHPSPTVWPPPATYAQMRVLVAEVLPGGRYRRHLYWRWSVVWTRPAA